VAELNQKQLDAIKKAAPGFRVAAPASDAADARQRYAADAAEDSTPDIDQAKRKPNASSSVEADGPDPDPPAPPSQGTMTPDDGDQIVALEPEHPADPWDRRSQAKSIVVDRDGKVIGRQG
jgi:hypothetical protein